MSITRTLARAAAAAGVLALVAGPLASGAQAAPKKKTPTPVITAKPANPTNAQTATFAFTDTLATATFTCSLDFTPYAACTSPTTYSGPLAAGSHTFRIRATAPTRTPSATASWTWTVDITPPPVPVLNGAPSGTTTSDSASLTFTDAQGGVTFLCSLDGATASACTSPVNLTSLADGPHTFSVAARDAAGNVSAAASGAWTVDTTPPPVPTITTGPAALTNQTTATFLVADTDASAILTCSLDGGAYAACGPNATYSSLASGPHTFDLRASDTVGNTSDAPQYAWTVDTSQPTPPSVSGPSAYTNNPVAQFTLGLPGDAVSLRCNLDGAGYAACTSPYTTGSLADGAHTLLVVARNAADTDSSPTPWNWTVDTQAPPQPAVTGPAARTKATSATFTVTDTENGVALTCALDGDATPDACGPTYSVAGPLAAGPHTLVVTATDAAGNTSTRSYTWTVDLTPPTVTFTLPATVTGAVTATFNEAVRNVTATSLALRVVNSTTNVPASIACKNAGGTAVSCATGAVKTATLKPSKPLVPGQRYYAVANPAGARTIVDLAGNLLAVKTGTFRAQTVIQEQSVANAMAWRNVASASAYGSAYRTEHLAGATASIGFTGTGITWYTIKGPSQGLAYVYVDGVKKATVNNYAATTTYKVGRGIGGLTNARHTLKIVVAGLKGSTSGTGTSVAVDATKSGGVLVTNPAMSYRWRISSVPGASGGYLASADLGGAASSMTFRGTGVSWYTSSGRNRGIAKLYVDGVLKGTYDLYAASTTYNVRRSVSGLTNAVHTVRVVVTGTHRAGATGSLVTVDRWVVA